MFHLGVLMGNKPMSGSFGDLLSLCVCVHMHICVQSQSHVVNPVRSNFASFRI